MTPSPACRMHTGRDFNNAKHRHGDFCSSADSCTCCVLHNIAVGQTHSACKSQRGARVYYLIAAPGRVSLGPHCVADPVGRRQNGAVLSVAALQGANTVTQAALCCSERRMRERDPRGEVCVCARSVRPICPRQRDAETGPFPRRAPIGCAWSRLAPSLIQNKVEADVTHTPPPRARSRRRTSVHTRTHTHWISFKQSRNSLLLSRLPLSPPFCFVSGVRGGWAPIRPLPRVLLQGTHPL